MNNVVLITSLDTVFNEKLAAAFAREGFRVFALCDKPADEIILLPPDPYKAAEELKRQSGKLDYLLDTTDVRHPDDTFTARDGIDGSVIENVFRQNVLRSMAILEAFLPLLDEGEGKRLFYLTRAEGSINETRRCDHFGYAMSKAALHQFLQMTRNKLAPQGYTFRVFDPLDGELAPEAALQEARAESAFNYITRRRGTENNDPLRDDEENLVFRDAQGRQHSW
jgi:NAD(P)-dependent dehydrogenase (short-subunit alcohol dehydrogenase family)